METLAVSLVTIFAFVRLAGMAADDVAEMARGTRRFWPWGD